MIDIETFGKNPNSVIVSIGAVAFDIETGKTGKEFKLNVSAEDCVKNGLEIDVDTFEWWLKQSKEAQESLLSDELPRQYLNVAILSFIGFISENFDTDNLKVWANSPSFDLVILKNAFRKLDIRPVWEYYNERDCRTLVQLLPGIKEKVVFNGVKHSVIDDCKYQIKYCSEIYKTLIHGKN